MRSTTQWAVRYLCSTVQYSQNNTELYTRSPTLWVVSSFRDLGRKLAQTLMTLFALQLNFCKTSHGEVPQQPHQTTSDRLCWRLRGQ